MVFLSFPPSLLSTRLFVIIYRRLPRRSDATSGHHVSGSVATAATAATGEAGDDDVEEADDAVDDGG